MSISLQLVGGATAGSLSEEESIGGCFPAPGLCFDEDLWSAPGALGWLAGALGLAYSRCLWGCATRPELATVERKRKLYSVDSLWDFRGTVLTSAAYFR